MKKFYVSLAAIAFSGLAIGQGAQKAELRTAQEGTFATDSKNIPTQNAIINQKSGGVVAWSSDFSNAGDWTIDNAGEPAPFGWEIHSGAPNSWFYSTGITSTSGGEYAELYNGDPTTNNPAPVSQTFTMTTTNAIDVQTLAGTDQVSVTFEQYGARFQDLQELYVSTDGTTFQKVADNDDIPNLTSGGGSSYANPMLRSFNIAPFIAGNASTVYLRFSWSPDVQNITYGWMIDDVQIVTNPDYDNTMTAYGMGMGTFQFPYYMISTAQASPISFWGEVTNNGALDQPGTQLDVTVGGSTYSSAAATLPVNGSDSLVTATQFTPAAAVASFTANFEMVATNTDENTADNTGSIDFEVTDHVYGRDLAGNGSNVEGSVTNWANAGGDAFKIGNIFEIMADETFKGIDVILASGNYTANSPVLFAEVYKYDGTDYIFLEQTIELPITSASQQNTVLTLPLYSPIDVQAGDDILVVAAHYGGDASGSDDIAVAYSGDAPENSVVGYDGSNSLVGLAGPVNICVRLNGDPTIGINELPEVGLTLGQNMPNPFNSNSIINFELDNASDIRFEFVDISGKVVKSVDLGTLSAGNHQLDVDASEFSTGVYYYSMISGEYRLTEKMIVQK